MLIFAIDDEPMLLADSAQTIRDAVENAEVMEFTRGNAALEAIRQDGLKPQAVFCDIEMPGMNGLDFAAELKELCPDTMVIFVTSFSEYAVEAYRLHANGYVMKPLEEERVREELASLITVPQEEPKGLHVQCFGNFEVFYKGRPIDFERRKTKELLAYLVDREGAYCSAEEIVAVLWEDERDLKLAKGRLRKLISDLRHSLRDIGMEEVLLRKSGLVAIRPDLLECDYYRMLEGDVSMVKIFRGEYMSQYSWAEVTTAKLFFRMRHEMQEIGMNNAANVTILDAKDTII